MESEKTGGKTNPKAVKMTKGEVGDIGRTSWGHLTKQMKLTTAQMIPLKEAKYPAKVNGLPATLFRYFDIDKAKEKELTFNDYESLNEHPELILYEGYRVLGKGGEVNIQKRENGEASFLEEGIKQGHITEIGVITPKTGTQKWLGRIGTFMMMGGFIVVLFVIVGLVIGISIAAQRC